MAEEKEELFFDMTFDHDCPACNGTGKVEEDAGGGRIREYKCTPCRGTGKKSGYTGTFPEFLKEDQ